jgi:hypothetical protein
MEAAGIAERGFCSEWTRAKALEEKKRRRRRSSSGLTTSS